MSKTMSAASKGSATKPAPVLSPRTTEKIGPITTPFTSRVTSGGKK